MQEILAASKKLLTFYDKQSFLPTKFLLGTAGSSLGVNPYIRNTYITLRGITPECESTLSFFCF